MLSPAHADLARISPRQAEAEELSVDETELDGADWFERDFVREQLSLQGDSDAPPSEGDFHVPSRISLARTLIESWLQEV
jgi:NAD+ diphosphatase